MAKTREEKERAAATAATYQQGDIAGLDGATTRRLIASTVLTESNGGNLRITNAQGYVGRYQAGAGWLVDAGYVDPGKLGAAMAGYKSEWAWADSGNRDKMDKFLADPGNWKDGLSLEKYKNSAELQDKAFKINCDAATRRAFKEGVLHKDDRPEQIAGFLKARHLSGYGGAKAAVTGGKVISDGNGTSNYDYLHDITRNRDGLDEFMSRDLTRRSQTSPTARKETPATQISRPDAIAAGVLREGERGPDVHGLQHSLNTLGYRDAQGHPLKLDSDFGQRTKEAVEAFQRANGLKVDGLAGPDTLQSIGKQLPGGKVTVTVEPTGINTVASSSHPDNLLFKQSLDGLKNLDPQTLGFRSEQQYQNAAASLAFEAKVSGLKHIDHVVLNTTGTGLFAVQGRMDDPGHHRIYIDKAQAAAQSVEQSTQQMVQEARNQPSPPIYDALERRTVIT